MNTQNPTQIKKGKNSLRLSRVYRSGRWAYNPSYVRASYRDNYTPTYRGIGIGFRLVRNK